MSNYFPQIIAMGISIFEIVDETCKNSDSIVLAVIFIKILHILFQ